MTDEEINEIIRGENHSSDRWGAIAYSTEQVRNITHKINAIMQERLNQQSIEIAQKDAKIYAYEAIITNSNFKAVLPKKKQEDEK